MSVQKKKNTFDSHSTQVANEDEHTIGKDRDKNTGTTQTHWWTSIKPPSGNRLKNKYTHTKTNKQTNKQTKNKPKFTLPHSFLFMNDLQPKFTLPHYLLLMNDLQEKT